jgi:5'-3' exonuclease
MIDSISTSKSNKEARSTIIVSNDYDIKQLVNYGTTPLYINMMTNEMYNKENYSKNYKPL